MFWKFRVKDFGPLWVGIDSHGDSMYRDVQRRAEEAGGHRWAFEPRGGGLTHVLDKGLGSRAWEDVLETAGHYIDIVKPRGTAYVTQHLQRKLDVLRGKTVVIGGTFFEVVFVKDKLDEYKSWLSELGLTHVEISDGTVEIPRDRKLELIADSHATSRFSPRSAPKTRPSSWTPTSGWAGGRGARGRCLEGDH